MANIEKVQIFIDGGNFHHLVLKKLALRELDFSFEEFVNFLANGRIIPPLGKRFYVGTVRERPNNQRSKQAMSRQVSLFTVLKSYGWELKSSKLRTRVERVIIDDRVFDYEELKRKGVNEIVYERTREKGIDVKLAVDLIAGAIDNKYDTAIIVSSDADLVPAIDWVRIRRRKKIEYIGFSIKDKAKDKEYTKPLQTMITYSDVQRILVESDLKPFIKPFTQRRLK